MCKSRGMHVAQLERQEESDSVAKFLIDVGLSATPFFITQLVELIPGKPASKLQEGCSSIFNSLLRSQSCTEEINFMCENSKKPFELLPFDKGYY
jgi:hypothetical protein